MSDLFGDPAVGKPYRDKLRISLRGAIDFARRRQEKRLRIGKAAAQVTLTLDEAMGVLREQDVRIVLLGVNSLRGTGTDADMYFTARALGANGSHP